MAFTRLCTAAQVKQHIENIETSELTDNQIDAFIDQVGEEIRSGFGYPYRQVLTDTTTNERIYYLGEKDIYSVEKVFYDDVEATVSDDYTVNLENGTITFDAGFTVESKEVRVWIMPREFNEYAAAKTALFIMRLAEGFQRGEASLNLIILERKVQEFERRLPLIQFFEVDSMHSSSVSDNPYNKNAVRVVQDHTDNAYL